MLVKIKDICQVVSGATPATNIPSFYDGNIYRITPKDLADNNNRKYIDNCSRKITENGYNSCSTVMIPKNNILISTRAPIGYIAINNMECCTNQGFKSLICDTNKVDADYLYYLLKTRMHEIELLGSGTTFKEVSKISIENFEVDLISLDIQKKIASILSSIDIQIERNNAMTKRLQVLGQTVFNKFYSSNLMCFNGTFGDLCVILSGYSFKPSSYVVSGKYDLITIKNLNGTFVDNKKTNKIDLIPSSLKKYCILEEGDILVSLTGNVGRVSINSSQHALLNQRVSKVICKNNDYKYFLYLMLNTQYYQEKMRQISNGTSQKNLSPLDIEKIKIYIPSNIEDFNNATKGLLKRMCQINISTIKLIALKEKLLPLLINRQLV